MSARVLSRRLVDRFTRAQLRRLAVSGHFEASALTRDWLARMGRRDA